MSLASDLHESIDPQGKFIVGVSIGQPEDKSTWRIHFKPETGSDKRDELQAALDAFDLDAYEKAQEDRAYIPLRKKGYLDRIRTLKDYPEAGFEDGIGFVLDAVLKQQANIVAALQAADIDVAVDEEWSALLDAIAAVKQEHPKP